jgi:hypothetical protein
VIDTSSLKSDTSKSDRELLIALSERLQKLELEKAAGEERAAAEKRALRVDLAQQNEELLEQGQKLAELQDAETIRGRTGGTSVIYKDGEPLHDKLKSPYPRKSSWRQYSRCEDLRLPNRAVHAFPTQKFATDTIRDVYGAFSPAGRLEIDSLYTSQSFLHDIVDEFDTHLRYVFTVQKTGEVCPKQHTRLLQLVRWLKDIRNFHDSRITELIASKTSPALAQIARAKAQNERFALQLPDSDFGAELLQAADECAKMEYQFAVKNAGREAARKRGNISGLFDYKAAASRAASRGEPEGSEARSNWSKDRSSGRDPYEGRRREGQGGGRERSQSRGRSQERDKSTERPGSSSWKSPGGTPWNRSREHTPDRFHTPEKFRPSGPGPDRK